MPRYNHPLPDSVGPNKEGRSEVCGRAGSTIWSCYTWQVCAGSYWVQGAYICEEPTDGGPGKDIARQQISTTQLCVECPGHQLTSPIKAQRVSLCSVSRRWHVIVVWATVLHIAPVAGAKCTRYGANGQLHTCMTKQIPPVI